MLPSVFSSSPALLHDPSPCWVTFQAIAGIYLALAYRLGAGLRTFEQVVTALFSSTCLQLGYLPLRRSAEDVLILAALAGQRSSLLREIPREGSMSQAELGQPEFP